MLIFFKIEIKIKIVGNSFSTWETLPSKKKHMVKTYGPHEKLHLSCKSLKCHLKWWIT